jgi:hypothetical protein
LREAIVLPALVLTLWLTSPAAQQRHLSDEQIDQVIAYARTGDGLGGVRCYAAARTGDPSGFSGGFAVMLTGPAGRIFDAVKAAQAKGLDFSRAQVTAEMAATTLVVVAYPEAPKSDSSGAHDTPHATGVMIRAGGPQRIVIKPRTTETLPRSTTGGQGVRAVFAYEDFATIHFGGFEVVIVAGEAERVCTIDSAARASIR